jgi:uncharacterized protein YndB with AHSA1/START domain
METKEPSRDELERRTLFIERVFDAPRKTVFRAWTEREHMARWWGPAGFASTIEKLELRPGGAYRIHMRSPEGTDHWSQGVYREIVAPERLVMAGCWTDANGDPVSRESVLTVTFEELAGKTRLTLRQVLESVTSRDSHRGGWTSSLGRLAEHLANA